MDAFLLGHGVQALLTPKDQRIKPVLRLCMPNNAHMNDIAFLQRPD